MPTKINSIITGSFAGVSTALVLANIPKGWKKVPADTGHDKGWKLLDENNYERVRFMYPTQNYPSGYWIRKNESDQFLDESGSMISGKFKKGEQKGIRHIPYTGS